MKKRMIVLALCLAVTQSLFAQQKEEKRIVNSAAVLRELLAADNGLSTHVLDQADCVVIFPSVKKIAIGIGGSYGRGLLVCRTGPKMDGPGNSGDVQTRPNQHWRATRVDSDRFCAHGDESKGRRTNPERKDETWVKRGRGCRSHRRSGNIV